MAKRNHLTLKARTRIQEKSDLEKVEEKEKRGVSKIGVTKKNKSKSRKTENKSRAKMRKIAGKKKYHNKKGKK